MTVSHGVGVNANASLSTPSRPARPATRGPWLTFATIALGFLPGLRSQAEFDSEKYLLYEVGPVTLRPRLEVEEGFNSNIFYAETNRIDDFYTFIRPGLGVVYGSKTDNYVSIGYTMEAAIYATRDDLDYLGHLLSHESRLRLGRILVTGRDRFSISRTTLGGNFSYVQRPVGLIALNDDWRADYDLSPKTTVGVGIGLDYADYDASDLGTFQLYDYLALQGSLRVGYLPSDKIVVFPQFTFGNTWLDPNQATAPDAPHLTAYGFNLGAEGEFTPKLTGSVTGGYEMREYSDGSEVPDGWVASLLLKWQPRVKTGVSVGFRHWIQSVRDASGIAYTADRLFVSVSQELGTQGRWSVSLAGYYQFHEYSEDYIIGGVRVRRADDLGGFNVGGSYRWTPWLTAIVGYDFSAYSDNVPSIPDYDVHRISLRLSAGY